jgi:AraC family transcriptional regulator of arabinose operon
VVVAFRIYRMTMGMKSTPHLTATAITTGHFRERRGYAVWREHGTADWLLIYTVGGRGRFGYAGGELAAEPGDVVLLKPGVLHDYGVERELERWELLWAHFQPRVHWLDWMEWPAEGGVMRLRIGDRSLRGRVRKRLLDMHRLATGAAGRREALAMNALEEVLLWCDGVNPLGAQGRLDPRVRAAMDFLCRRIEQKVTMGVLAAHVNLSVSRLAHLFQEEVGTTPQQFLEVQRLDRAKQLLALTQGSIKEIAYSVGFENPFYFTLRFKRYAGVSPRAWRRRQEGVNHR